MTNLKVAKNKLVKIISAHMAGAMPQGSQPTIQVIAFDADNMVIDICESELENFVTKHAKARAWFERWSARATAWGAVKFEVKTLTNEFDGNWDRVLFHDIIEVAS